VEIRITIPFTKMPYTHQTHTHSLTCTQTHTLTHAHKRTHAHSYVSKKARAWVVPAPRPPSRCGALHPLRRNTCRAGTCSRAVCACVCVCVRVCVCVLTSMISLLCIISELHPDNTPPPTNLGGAGACVPSKYVVHIFRLKIGSSPGDAFSKKIEVKAQKSVRPKHGICSGPQVAKLRISNGPLHVLGDVLACRRWSYHNPQPTK